MLTRGRQKNASVAGARRVECARSALDDRLGNRNDVSVDYAVRPGAELGWANFIGGSWSPDRRARGPAIVVINLIAKLAQRANSLH